MGEVAEMEDVAMVEEKGAVLLNSQDLAGLMQCLGQYRYSSSKKKATKFRSSS